MKTSPAIQIGTLVLTLAALLGSGCSQEAKRERLLERAAAHFAAGDLERARIEYRNVLQTDPKNLVALEQLGNVWLERGAPMRALPFLLEVRALSPDNRDVQLQALRIALGSGKLDEARKGALALLKRAPGNTSALLLLFETVRSPEHQEELRRLLRSFPDRNTPEFHLAHASLALQQGNVAAAKTSLERALAADPKSAAAHAAMAHFHLRQRDLTRAGEEFAAAAEHAPLRSNDRLRLLEFKARTGAQADAVAGLKALTQKAPDFLPAWRSLAQIAWHEKKRDEAFAHLEKIFSRDPGNYEARLLRAALWRDQGEITKSIAELESLTADYPGLASPHYDLAQAHLQNREPVKATDSLQRAIVQNPDHEQAILLLAGLQLRAGEAQSALYALVDLLTRRPHLERAQLLLVDALGALGRLDDIVRLTRDSIAAAPGNPRAHILLGLVLARQGKLADARASLEKSLELAPDALPVVAELVRLDLHEKNIASARQRVQQQREKYPDLAAVHLLDARVLAAEASWDQAEAAALRALALEPASTVAYELIAACYVARKNSPDAQARLEAFLAERRDDSGAHWMAGNVFLQWRDFARARDAYERQLALQPDTVSVLNNLAYIYSEPLPNLDRAHELAERAHRLAPQSAEIADTLGWILYKRQDYARAVALLRESAAKRPNDPEIQSHFKLASQMAAAEPIAK